MIDSLSQNRRPMQLSILALINIFIVNHCNMD